MCDMSASPQRHAVTNTVSNGVVKFLIYLYQISQFEDVKFEAASILSEFYCQQVGANI